MCSRCLDAIYYEQYQFYPGQPLLAIPVDNAVQVASYLLFVAYKYCNMSTDKSWTVQCTADLGDINKTNSI